MNKKKIRRLGIMIANYMNLTKQLKEKVQKLQEVCKLQQKEIKELKRQVTKHEQTIGKTQKSASIH